MFIKFKSQNVHFNKACRSSDGMGKGIQDDLGQVLLAGPTVLLDTLQIDLKMSLRQGLHTGDGCRPAPYRG